MVKRELHKYYYATIALEHLLDLLWMLDINSVGPESERYIRREFVRKYSKLDVI